MIELQDLHSLPTFAPSANETQRRVEGKYKSPTDKGQQNVNSTNAEATQCNDR